MVARSRSGSPADARGSFAPLFARSASASSLALAGGFAASAAFAAAASAATARGGARPPPAPAPVLDDDAARALFGGVVAGNALFPPSLARVAIAALPVALCDASAARPSRRLPPLGLSASGAVRAYSPANAKTYDLDVPSFASAFAPGAVALRAFVNFGMAYKDAGSDWITQMAEIARQEEEHGVELPHPPFGPHGPHLREGAFLFAKETVVNLLKILYAKLALARLDARVCSKLLKDARISLSRKRARPEWAFALAPIERATSAAATAARSKLLLVAAQCSVAAMQSAYACRVLYRVRAEEEEAEGEEAGGEGEGKNDDAARRARRKAAFREAARAWARSMSRHVARHGSVLVGGALAAGLLGAARAGEWPSPWAGPKLVYLAMVAGEVAGPIVAGGIADWAARG
jgi:hypothetical protein